MSDIDIVHIIALQVIVILRTQIPVLGAVGAYIEILAGLMAELHTVVDEVAQDRHVVGAIERKKLRMNTGVITVVIDRCVIDAVKRCANVKQRFCAEPQSSLSRAGKNKMQIIAAKLVAVQLAQIRIAIAIGVHIKGRNRLVAPVHAVLHKITQHRVSVFAKRVDQLRTDTGVITVIIDKRVVHTVIDRRVSSGRHSRRRRDRKRDKHHGCQQGCQTLVNLHGFLR